MKITDYSLKELKEMAREQGIKGRSKMNKIELFYAVKTAKDAEELMAKDVEVEHKKIKEEARKEAEIRVWADVLRTMPAGTDVIVKVIDRNKKDRYFDVKLGRIKIGDKQTEDGLPDAYVRTKHDCGRPYTYQIENNDLVHFYMNENDFKKIKYGGYGNEHKSKKIRNK